MEKRIEVEGELKDLKPGKGVAGYEYGSNLETQGVQIADPGVGKTISIRAFEFKMNPDPKVREFFPDAQTLFNVHAKQIQTILWGDGLRYLEEVSPRVIIDKKRLNYRIFVPCEARLNVNFMDKPQSLNETLSKASRAPKNGSIRNKK